VIRSIVGILIALLLATPVHAENWSIEKLTGLAPEFDGPSCYTAALLAKGYVDTVSFVGTKELEFFLDRFCEETTGPLKPGYLLTLSDGKFTGARAHNNHIATYLGDGNVFEKEGGLGKFEPYDIQDPHFRVRPLKESPWFNGSRLDGQVMRAYQCQDAKTVRAQTASCEARVNALGMAELRRDFERVLLTTPAKFDPNTSNLQTIKRLTQELSKLTDSDPCYDYILAMGEMVASSFKMMRIKHLAEILKPEQWKNARADLEHVLFAKFQIGYSPR
jgi:hypothetical protein